jgi:DNA-binding XRE family transcriptional regulator
VFVTHPNYIREKARQMRVEKDLTIDEIAERLGISRQTIFYWVKDVPLKKPRRHPDYELRARENSLRFKRLRDQAYGRNWRSRWGVLTIRTSDTYFRARLQAWIDRLNEEWLDFAA